MQSSRDGITTTPTCSALASRQVHPPTPGTLGGECKPTLNSLELPTTVLSERAWIEAFGIC